MHLGRRPARLPEDLAEWGIAAGELGPGAALDAAVDEAIRREVDAVLFAGDLVDADNRFFEAYGTLERALVRLQEAGIPAVAVAGNHDVDVLPRLARELPGFRVLGEGGRWQTELIRRDGEPALQVVGWSFPQAHHRDDPLVGADAVLARLDPTVPAVGLLHADLDLPGSVYAPVSSRRLAETPVAGWLLGHVHAPSPLAAPRPRGYLGSLVGLDPGEPGPRGPWLVRIDADWRVHPEHLPSAPLRWERLELDVSELPAPAELEPALARLLEEAHERLRPDGVRVVGCRVHLTGRSVAAAGLRDALADRPPTVLRRRLDGVLYFVERAVPAFRGALDLDQLARGDDPPGLLARQLRALERGTEDPLCRELVGAARARLESVSGQRQWSRLDRADLSDASVRQLLVDEGWALLDRLVASGEGRR
jgi:hypothetical protein